MKIISQMVRLVAEDFEGVVTWSRLSLLFLSLGSRSKKGPWGPREWWKLADHLLVVWQAQILKEGVPFLQVSEDVLNSILRDGETEREAPVVRNLVLLEVGGDRP